MDLTTFLLFIGLLGEGGGGGGGGGVTPGPSPGPAPAPGPGPAPGPSPRPPPAPAPIPHIIPIKPRPKPFPTPVQPQGAPPYPGPAWVACPTTPQITARATYWNPILWDFPSKTIRKPQVQEMLGGQWVTFVAAWHPGPDGAKTFMATEAYCLRTVKPPAPTPGPTPGPQPTPQHPGENFSYSGQPADPATIQHWGTTLASVNPYDIKNAWIVRMWEWAAGLTQTPGGPGWDQVEPPGTDGRYGRDAHDAMVKFGIPNPPAVAATRPSWWGVEHAYANPNEPAAPPGTFTPQPAPAPQGGGGGGLPASYPNA